jgi:hypothetical protein
MKIFHWPKRRLLLGGLLLGTLWLPAIAPVLPHPQAVQLGDGSTMFTSPPRLVSFVTTRDRANDRNATYYVTVDLLPAAGEPLQTLQVSLIAGRFTRLNYHTDEIEVFQGDRGDRGEGFAIAAANYEDDTQTLTIQMTEPITPGQRITFALKPVRNPAWEGVYLYEVTAAPAGPNPVFQRVGTGRIHIYRPDGIDPFLLRSLSSPMAR